MNDHRDDKEFEAFLAGESELAERYKELGRDEPPPEVDAHILAEARNAAKVHRVEFGPRGGWLKPVALAATILLSLSLVMNIVLQSPTRFEQVVTGTSDMSDLLDTEQDETLEGEPTTTRRKSTQAPVTGIEEIMVTARKRSSDDAAPQPEMPADAPMPVSSMQAADRITERDAAFLIVAEYIVAADNSRADVEVMERRLADKSERAQERPGSVAAERVVTLAKEDESDEDIRKESKSALREIDRLYAGGERAEAVRLLDEFLERYPEHPVSVKIRQQEN